MERRGRGGSHRTRIVRRRVLAVTRAACLFGALALVGPISAARAEPPQIVSSSVEGVTAITVTLHGSIDPEGIETTYRYEYLTLAAYEANVAAARRSVRGGRVRPGGRQWPGRLGQRSDRLNPQELKGLAPETAYRYRLGAQNADEEVTYGVAHPFATQSSTNAFELLDHRGWEMVSPIEKAAAPSSRPGRSPAAGFSRRRPTAARSPSAPPTHSGKERRGARGQPVPGDPHRRRLDNRQHHHARAVGELRLRTRRRPVSALLRRPRLRPALERGTVPRRGGWRMPRRQPAVAGLGGARRIPRLLPA